MEPLGLGLISETSVVIYLWEFHFSKALNSAFETIFHNQCGCERRLS